MPPWYPLIGEHELTVDDKGRLLVPSDIRRRLEGSGEGDTLILTKSGRVACLYPEKYHLDRLAAVKTSLFATATEQSLMRAMFGTATRVAWDKQGRILLPPKTAAAFKLQREVVMVCAGDCMELWNPTEWEAEQAGIPEQMPNWIEQLSAKLEPTTKVRTTEADRPQ